MQMDLIMANIYPKSQVNLHIQDYKELLEEVLNEAIHPNASPLPWLLEETGPDQMQSSVDRFKDILNKFLDSDSEQASLIQKEPTPQIKSKAGRPKGSIKKPKAPALNDESEDEKEMLEKFRIIKEHIKRSGGSIKMKRSIAIFGVGLINAKSSNISPELKEKLYRAEELLD